MNESDVRQELRTWVRSKVAEDAPTIDDSTQLIASRLITSLQVMDLLLFLEELRQEPINPSSLRPGTRCRRDPSLPSWNTCLARVAPTSASRTPFRPAIPGR